MLDLALANIAMTPCAAMMYAVTEYGIVNLQGQSLADRAKAPISIGHPDYRWILKHEARENGLIAKGYF